MTNTSPTTPAERRCRNCGTPLAGRYCTVCGQEDHAIAVPLYRLILDFLSDQFQFDGRLWRTLTLLLFHPGRLTGEYLAGRRQRYIPPVRLYLFISIVFFLAVGLLPRNDTRVRMLPSQLQTFTSSTAAPPTASIHGPHTATKPAPAVAGSSNLARTILYGVDKSAGGETPAQARHLHGFARWLFKKSMAVKGHPERFKRQFLHNVPKVLFVLIPLFALLLKLLYLLRDRYYSEHLIFALHYHSLVFLNGLAIALLSVGANTTRAWLSDTMGWAAGLLTLWTGLYVIPALRTTYGGNWPQAIWRGSVVIFLYFFVAVVFGAVGAIAITFAMTGS